MKFELKYKICLWKSYLDKGLGLTNYIKYLVAFIALASSDLQLTIAMGIIYGLISFLLGWWWFTSDFMKAEIEVGNRYNIFVKEMRRFKNSKGVSKR